MYGMCTEYDNFCQIHLDRYNALCKSYFAKYVLCVDTCLYYFFPPPNTVWTNRLWCQTEFQLQRARTVHLNQ